jgi:hypothetical protein
VLQTSDASAVQCQPACMLGGEALLRNINDSNP